MKLSLDTVVCSNSRVTLAICYLSFLLTLESITAKSFELTQNVFGHLPTNSSGERVSNNFCSGKLTAPFYSI